MYVSLYPRTQKQNSKSEQREIIEHENNVWKERIRNICVVYSEGKTVICSIFIWLYGSWWGLSEGWKGGQEE